MTFRRKDLVGLEGLERGELESLLDRAEALWPVATRAAPIDDASANAARRLSVVNLFLEPSTRTRCSFELAEARLGVERLTIGGEPLSLAKGETLHDTVRVLEAIRVNTVILRHPEEGAPAAVAHALPSVHVVNAGDGVHEHPTQGLVDLFVLRRRWGSLDGRRVVIVGDIEHSRVARSNAFGLAALGAKAVLCGPRGLLPDDPPGGAELTDDLEAALDGADAVMALRIQRERFAADESLPDAEAYRRRFGLTAERAERLRPDVPILHPGPVNRGVEMDGEVMDGPRSVVFAQVAAAVAVRMALLLALAESPLPDD